MEKSGTIYTFTQIFVAAEQFQDKTPYYCAIIEGDDGIRFPAYIVGAGENETVEIGKRAKFDSLDEHGQAQYIICS